MSFFLNTMFMVHHVLPVKVLHILSSLQCLVSGNLPNIIVIVDSLHIYFIFQIIVGITLCVSLLFLQLLCFQTTGESS